LIRENLSPENSTPSISLSLVLFSWRLKDDKEVHPKKLEAPTVAFSGIDIVVRLVHPWNA